MKSIIKFFHRQIFLTCLILSSTILLVKIYIVPDTVEFIEPTSIYTALLSSLIFIYGFMIAPAVSEYKESERMRIELKATIQNILSDVDYFERLNDEARGEVFLKPFSQILRDIFDYIADDKRIPPIYEGILSLNIFLVQAEKSGIPANHIIKVKQEIGNFRRIVARIIQIKENDSLPRVIHNLKNFITFFIISTLLFLNIGNTSVDTLFGELKEGTIIFLLSFIYLYLSSIITSLENPFSKRKFLGYIDISYLKRFADAISPR